MLLFSCQETVLRSEWNCSESAFCFQAAYQRGRVQFSINIGCMVFYLLWLSLLCSSHCTCFPSAVRTQISTCVLLIFIALKEPIVTSEEKIDFCVYHSLYKESDLTFSSIQLVDTKTFIVLFEVSFMSSSRHLCFQAPPCNYYSNSSFSPLAGPQPFLHLPALQCYPVECRWVLLLCCGHCFHVGHFHSYLSVHHQKGEIHNFSSPPNF